MNFPEVFVEKNEFKSHAEEVDKKLDHIELMIMICALCVALVLAVVIVQCLYTFFKSPAPLPPMPKPEKKKSKKHKKSKSKKKKEDKKPQQVSHKNDFNLPSQSVMVDVDIDQSTKFPSLAEKKKAEDQMKAAGPQQMAIGAPPTYESTRSTNSVDSSRRAPAQPLGFEPLASPPPVSTPEPSVNPQRSQTSQYATLPQDNGPRSAYCQPYYQSPPPVPLMSPASSTPVTPMVSPYSERNSTNVSMAEAFRNASASVPEPGSTNTAMSASTESTGIEKTATFGTRANTMTAPSGSEASGIEKTATAGTRRTAVMTDATQLGTSAPVTPNNTSEN